MEYTELDRRVNIKVGVENIKELLVKDADLRPAVYITSRKL